MWENWNIRDITPPSEKWMEILLVTALFEWGIDGDNGIFLGTVFLRESSQDLVLLVRKVDRCLFDLVTGFSFNSEPLP